MSFRLGSLDHVHIRVPDRAAAAAWYAEHLGFEPVQDYRFWAEAFPGGPLQISADGGKTMLALFQATDSHPMLPQQTGVAFSVAAEVFVAFARSLPGAIPGMSGAPLRAEEIIDFDLCFAYEFTDPWRNRFELNCYEHARVKAALVDGDGLQVVRYWPGSLLPQFKGQ